MKRPGPPPTAQHGTPSRWRKGCRCDQCSRAHLDDQATYIHDTAMRRWIPLGPALCALLESGYIYRDALIQVGVTAQAVTAHRRRDPQFSARLDQALIAGRDDRLEHGTPSAWRSGCRCPDCRDYHEASRG